MSASNDGGPAFPRNITVFGHQNKIDADTGTGMSLRDWFAGQAMQQFVAERDHNVWAHELFALNRIEIARAAYNIADAMLAERNRKEAK